MDSIADVDEILANFLGTESKRRVKRFWLEALTIVAPYILQPLGEGLSKVISGGNVDQQRLEEYTHQISQLSSNQQDIINQLGAQRTMFQIDSEKKSNQINQLKRTQDSIQSELNILQNTVGKNFEEHEKKIQDLKEMLSETQSKLKKQAERQEKLINDVESIKADVKNIHETLEDIGKEINMNKNDINATKIETKLNSLSIDFNFLLSRFREEQKILLDVIKNANRGFLDPYIITPLNLIEMLRDVQSMLPEDSRLPFHPNFENAKALYNIIQPSIILHNNKILFILHLPLVHTKTFETFKMTSFPMPLGDDEFVYVSPKKEYLLINDKQSHLLEYVLTSASDFREFCKDLGKSKYICDQIQQTNGPSSSLECEAQLFLNKKELSGSCNTRVMKLTKSVFIKLLQYGAWIYVAPQPENLIVTCGGGSRKNIILEGVGLLDLYKNCTAQTSEFGLQYIAGSKPAIVSSAYSSAITLTDYIDLSKIDDFDETAPENHKQLILPFEHSELDAVSVRIKDIISLRPVNDYSIAIIVVAIIIAVTLLIIIFRKKMYHCCSRKKDNNQSTCRYSRNLNNEIVPKQFL